MRGRLVGLTLGVASILVLIAALLPLRSHVAVATVTLIFVVPVIVGVVRGGLLVGLGIVVLGGLSLDFFFIKPYGTLTIGSAQNWVGLGVYLIVVALVARVTSNLEAARNEAHRNAENMRRVYELSERLVQEQTVDDLLVTIVHAVQDVFGFDGVSLFVLEGDQLRMAGSVGASLSEDELHRFGPHDGRWTSVSTALGANKDLRTVALASSGRPIGLLVLKGTQISDADRNVLITFANDAALAIERAHLHEQALRTKYLEEVDRLRRALMGAISHDLRTPLATIKVASSTLVNRLQLLSSSDTQELHELIEIESDRLTRLVSNLLDMTRIEAGVLKVNRESTSVRDLLTEAVSIMGPGVRSDRIVLILPDELPEVSIDPLLIIQVIVNLLDNALRHSPDQAPIIIEAALRGDRVVLSVSDQGPGIPIEDREAVFNRFVSFDTGGRAGLGLTIAKTFVEAHAENIWTDEAPGGGARFSFSMMRVTSATASNT